MAEPLVVELRSPEKTAFLRMTLAECSNDAVSLKFAVEASVRGFSARTESWVERIALRDFTAALVELERTRSGRAELQGQDPEDLGLTLSALDRVGHILLEFTISRASLVGDAMKPTALKLAGAFEADPSQLPGLVTQFKDLGRRVGL